MNDAAMIEQSVRPEGGWYLTDTADIIRAKAHLMLRAGLTQEEVEDVLGSVVSAVRAEYGS